jgi:hypothetical protein
MPPPNREASVMLAFRFCALTYASGVGLSGGPFSGEQGLVPQPAVLRGPLPANKKHLRVLQTHRLHAMLGSLFRAP